MKRKKHRETIRSFTILFQPAEEGGYNVFVPRLPGCVTQGATLDEARQMAEEAIHAYCTSLAKDGLPIPMEQKNTEQLVGQIDVRLQFA